MSQNIQADFYNGPSGRLLLTEFVPEQPPANGMVLLIPPFADEMNRCRRFLSVLGRELARMNWHCLLPDLFGTGDSAGDFSDASWQKWLADLNFAVSELRGPDMPLRVIGLRTGCLLGNDFVRDSSFSAEQAIWIAPVLGGQQFLKQWLRVRVTAAKFAGRNESVDDLMNMLSGGQAVEVGGYALSPELAAGLQAASMVESGSMAQKLSLILPGNSNGPLPAFRKWLERLDSNDVSHDWHAVEAEAFWASQEVRCPPQWVDAVLSVVQ